ncbi:MAG: hypothetical protein JNM17_34290 [Archangium sp.]|nr:hypothetical protein [Archangium sp.]
MKTMWLAVMFVVVASACQTTKGSEVPNGSKEGRDAVASEELKATLAALPKCEAGADAGRVSVAPTTCTKMYCGKACCNQCSWAASFEGKNGQKVPLDAEKARAVLKVGEGALDCEVAAWEQVLSTASLAIEGTACVVR